MDELSELKQQNSELNEKLSELKEQNSEMLCEVLSTVKKNLSELKEQGSKVEEQLSAVNKKLMKKADNLGKPTTSKVQNTKKVTKLINRKLVTPPERKEKSQIVNLSFNDFFELGQFRKKWLNQLKGGVKVCLAPHVKEDGTSVFLLEVDGQEEEVADDIKFSELWTIVAKTGGANPSFITVKRNGTEETVTVRIDHIQTVYTKPKNLLINRKLVTPPESKGGIQIPTDFKNCKNTTEFNKIWGHILKNGVKVC